MTDIRNEKLASLIREWVANTEGHSFTYDQLDRELGIVTPQSKNFRRQVIKRLKEGGLIVSAGQQTGLYRLVTDDAPVINWQDADETEVLDITLPFGMHELVKIQPKTVIVVAGSPDAGKTCWCFNLIKQNMHKHQIVYFSSEMGEVELKSRLAKFQTTKLQDWRFDARERSSNFADVIRPDWINIIDYMEISDEFFKVGGWIREVWEKLDKGIAVICLQKKRGVDLGRGGEVTAEKARLYIAMDSGKVRIIKAKNWATEQNPVGLGFTYKVVGGSRFVNVMPDENI